MTEISQVLFGLVKESISRPCLLFQALWCNNGGQMSPPCSVPVAYSALSEEEDPELLLNSHLPRCWAEAALMQGGRWPAPQPQPTGLESCTWERVTGWRKHSPVEPASSWAMPHQWGRSSMGNNIKPDKQKEGHTPSSGPTRLAPVKIHRKI